MEIIYEHVDGEQCACKKCLKSLYRQIAVFPSTQIDMLEYTEPKASTSVKIDYRVLKLATFVRPSLIHGWLDEMEKHSRLCSDGYDLMLNISDLYRTTNPKNLFDIIAGIYVEKNKAEKIPDKAHFIRAVFPIENYLKLKNIFVKTLKEHGGAKDWRRIFARRNCAENKVDVLLPELRKTEW